MPVQFDADRELEAIHTLLETWNADADRFRVAALAARKGEAPASSTVAALVEAHAGLLDVLDSTDRLAAHTRGGSAGFAAILQLQTTALALLESFSSSLDVLDRFAMEAVSAPRTITRGATEATADDTSAAVE